MVFNRSGATSRLEKVIHEVPTYSAICWGFRKMAKTQREALVNFAIWYITSLLKDVPLTILKT